MNAQIKWEMRRTKDGGYQGSVTLPSGGKGFKVRAKANTKEDALARAATVAAAVAANPLLQAVLPPGTGVAVKAVGYLARSAEAGQLAGAMGKITGEGAKRLVSALKFW